MIKVRSGNMSDIDSYLKYQLEAYPMESSERHRKFFLEKIRNSELIVAEVEGNYIGHAAFRAPGISPPFYDSFFIEEIVIAEKFRSKNYGSELMNKIIEKAKIMKAERILLDTKNDVNNRAIRFYEKFGFKKIGEITIMHRNQAFLCINLKK